jgi:hypothetical protein
LREIRTPLAIGYTWMLATWLAWQAWFSDSGRGDEFLGPLRDLGEVLTVLGAPIALGFVAYIVGSLSQDAFAPLLLKPTIAPFIGAEVLPRGVEQRWARFLRVTSIPAEERLRLRFGNQFYEGFLEIGGRSPDEADPVADAQDDLYRFQREVPDVAVELMAKRPDLFQEFDRHRAESDLRLAMIPPLLGLDLVLVLTAGPQWGLGLVVLPMLYLQGLQRLRLSNDVVATASLLLELSHPGVEAAKNRAERYRQGPG